MIDVRWLAIVLWAQPYYVGQYEGVEIRCYEWHGGVYQLNIASQAQLNFMVEGTMPTILQDNDAGFCRDGVCHDGG